jgi:hypothetical protein
MLYISMSESLYIEKERIMTEELIKKFIYSFIEVNGLKTNRPFLNFQ